MIELNDVEQKLATHLAKRRYIYARNQGFPDGKMGPQSNEETDLEGVGAELAFCKMFNLYPDLQIGKRNIHDAILRNGLLVDVKGTKYRTGHLIAVKKKADIPCDLYVLMIGEFPIYRCAGFIAASELLKDENIKDLGHGEGFAMSQEKLFMLKGGVNDG